MASNARLFRVVVPASDPQSSITFYSKLLNDPGRSVGGGRHYFDCGSVILAVLESNKPPIPEYFYFAVSELEPFFERAKELNCLSKEEVHGAPAGEIVVRPWRERSFYAYDPAENGLCFVDEKTLFTGQ
jgi:hypothetical protein